MMKAMINKYQEASREPQMTGSERDRETLICKYAPLVKYFAERLAIRLPPHISKEELISAGTLGLFNALDNYDPEKGIKFQTYAAYRVKGAILDELRKLDWVPRSVRRDIQRIETAIAALQTKLGREPNDFEIARELGLDLDRYFKILHRARGVHLVSLDGVRKEASSPVVETLASECPSPLEEVKKKELKQMVSKALATLTQKEQLVMSLYYYEDLTLKEISKVLGLTESRISQIHSKAIISLRVKLNSDSDD